jgi:uncharacterized protein (TIGR04255 family)
MGRVYRNPPVIEALCEFHFDTNSLWDVTIFGDYYHRVQAEFSGKRQLSQVEVAFEQREKRLDGELRDRGVRMQFFRPDGSAVVQLAPHFLAVNQLRPYRSWKAFKSLILARLSDYRQVVDAASLQRVSLRYVNHFEFLAQAFTIGTVFNPSEFLPAGLMQASAPFLLRLEMPQESTGRLALTMGTMESEQVEQVVVLLDLAVLVADVSGLDDKKLSVVLNKAHDRIEEVFESCLTDKLRAWFDEEV